MGIRNNRYTVEVPTVVDPIQRSGSIHAREAEFLRNNTKKKIKFTLPGPMTICDTIANDCYQTRSQMAFEFASILNKEAKDLEKMGVDIIQFDEPAFNSFTKETLDWGIDALETAAEGLKCATAVHICYGYGIQENINWKKTLGENWNQYQKIFPMLNKSSLNQVSLEFAGSKVPPTLMRLLPDKELMVGVITVVANKLETPEEVKNNILSSLKYVDYERLIPCSNCGMAPLPEKIALDKIKALGKGTALASK
jgi:5-methyltetrahydropteroyltriglutamate--homocysteine methyltransferase